MFLPIERKRINHIQIERSYRANGLNANIKMRAKCFQLNCIFSHKVQGLSMCPSEIAFARKRSNSISMIAYNYYNSIVPLIECNKGLKAVKKKQRNIAAQWTNLRRFDNESLIVDTRKWSDYTNEFIIAVNGRAWPWLHSHATRKESVGCAGLLPRTDWNLHTSLYLTHAPTPQKRSSSRSSPINYVH